MESAPYLRRKRDTAMRDYFIKSPWLYALMAFLLLALASLFLSYQGEPAYLKTLRAAGLPTGWDALQATHDDYAPEDNGAPLLIEAFRAMNALETKIDLEFLPYMGYADLPEPWEPLPRPMQRALLEFDEDAAEVRAIIGRALEHCVFRFDMDFSLGFSIPLDHLAPLRNLARVLAMHSLACALRGDAETTFAALQAERALAQVLGDGPFLIEELVRMAMYGIYLGSLEQCLNRVTLTPEHLKALQTTMEAPGMNSLQPMADTLTSELVAGLDEMERMKVGEARAMLLPGGYTQPIETDGTRLLGSERYPRVGAAWFGRSLLECSGLQAFNRLVHIRALRNGQTQAELPIYEAIQRDFTGEVLDLVPSRRAVMAQILLPALGRVYQGSARGIAQNDLARAALAILRYRHDHGAAPEALNALVPGYIAAIPIDPFSGETIRYIPKPEGILVYSFGHDRDDDGGAPPPEGKNILHGGDITFELQW